MAGREPGGRGAPATQAGRRRRVAHRTGAHARHAAVGARTEGRTDGRGARRRARWEASAPRAPHKDTTHPPTRWIQAKARSCRILNVF